MYSLNRPNCYILVHYLDIVPITDEMFINGCLRQWMNSVCSCLAIRLWINFINIYSSTLVECDSVTKWLKRYVFKVELWLLGILLLKRYYAKVEIWHRDLVVRAILKRNIMSMHGLLNACRKWNCNGTKYHYVSALCFSMRWLNMSLNKSNLSLQ